MLRIYFTEKHISLDINFSKNCTLVYLFSITISTYLVDRYLRSACSRRHITVTKRPLGLRRVRLSSTSIAGNGYACTDPSWLFNSTINNISKNTPKFLKLNFDNENLIFTSIDPKYIISNSLHSRSHVYPNCRKYSCYFY